VQPVDRDRAPCGRGESEIVVSVLDHRGPHETPGDRLVEVRVVLVGPGPLLSDPVDARPGLGEPPEVNPVGASRQLGGERLEGSGPGDRRVRGQHGLHRLSWHARGGLPADGELERKLLGQLPLARGLPAGGLVPGGWYHEAGGTALACLHPQDAGLEKHLIVEDAGVLEPAPESRDGRTGHQRLRIRPQRHVQDRRGFRHALKARA